MYNFKEQILEDLKLIQNTYGENDRNVLKDEYAFNYWILSRIYDIDEEIAYSLITEYNDKNIDCYVHFEESKELFIIQNKYYDEKTHLDRKEVADFLTTPLTHLKNNSYTRNKELQKIFTNAYNDDEYKIWFHFFMTNDNTSESIELLIKDFNLKITESGCATIRANMHYLSDIETIYYGQAFKEKQNFSYILNTVNKGTILQILPEEYQLEGMSKAFYIMTPISQIFQMYKEAKQKSYPLFEENIREYLGKNSVNNGIINTLKNSKDRNNFFYYNNGITVICESANKDTSNTLKLLKPQVVNGCQTVNTIYEVLSDFKAEDLNKEFKYSYVMVKVLVFNKEMEIEKPNFYRDIVKYTNRQNAINENAFGARLDLFYNLQGEFLRRGFLLEVKPGDKIKFKEKYNTKIAISELLLQANKLSSSINLELKTFQDIYVPLEKLLQVYIAIMLDGYYAYSKKNLILKNTSDIYKNYSTKINENLTIENMIRLILIYKRAEIQRSGSEDKRTPIPYYLIGFMGYFIKDKTKLNKVILNLFSNNKLFDEFYDYLTKLTNLYKKKYPAEYNFMIKKQIDIHLLEQQIETLDTISTNHNLNNFIKELRFTENIT